MSINSLTERLSLQEQYSPIYLQNLPGDKLSIRQDMFICYSSLLANMSREVQYEQPDHRAVL